MKKSASFRMSRRQFLISGSAALAGLALACGKSADTPSSPAAASAPKMNPTSIPTAASPIVQATRAPLAAPEGAADLILTNGKVFTVDHNNTITQAVAIKNGLIQAVGKNEEIDQLTGEATKVLDLSGRAVTPGMIDPHIHYRLIGLQTSYYTPLMPPEVTSYRHHATGACQGDCQKETRRLDHGLLPGVDGQHVPHKGRPGPGLPG